VDTLGSMELFVAVVDAGSFSAAARRLGLAPSSVARGIGGLEDELGVRLLARTTRRLSLTEPGRVYHERSRRILSEVEEARLSVARLEAAPRGLLRISVPVVFGRLHVAPALAEFLASYPEVEIDLSMTDAYVDLVEEGIDLAIRVGELQDSSLMARKLAPTRRVMCASPAYLERRGAPARPSDLKGHDCLSYRYSGAAPIWRLRAPDGTLHEIEVSGSLRTNNADALHIAALAGVGIVLLPTFLAGADIRGGRLRLLFEDHRVSATSSLDTNIHAVFPCNRHLSPKVRAFVDFLRRRFGPEPYWEAGCRSRDPMAACPEGAPVVALPPAVASGA
jgi:DNA-binding transcriptional LysR family regulator